MSADKEGLYKELTYKIIGALYEVHKELGGVHMITKAMQDQLYYYVKGTKYQLVLLANFGTPKLGIKRLIYTM
jgi:hypothetical protein